MVVIRLARKGAKKNPFYHIVAADSRSSRDGRYIEQMGYFNPTARGSEIRLHVNQERIDYWINHGAQTSDRIASLLKEMKKGVRPSAIPAAEYKKAQLEMANKAQAKKAAKAAEEAAKAAAAESAGDAAEETKSDDA